MNDTFVTKDGKMLNTFQLHNLERNEAVHLQVENFEVRIKRTDEGVILTVFDIDIDDGNDDGLASCHAFDNDTVSYQEGEDNG